MFIPTISCISVEEAINSSIVTPACFDSLYATQYVYVFLNSYACVNDVTEQLHDALVSTDTSPKCMQVLQTYYCNYIYPGCNPNGTNEPYGICKENCIEYLFGNSCKLEFSFLETFGMTSGLFSFPVQCDNTLRFVVESGLSVTTNDEDMCIDISGNDL
jgi:hypothetical protein